MATFTEAVTAYDWTPVVEGIGALAGLAVTVASAYASKVLIPKIAAKYALDLNTAQNQKLIDAGSRFALSVYTEAHADNKSILDPTVIMDSVHKVATQLGAGYAGTIASLGASNDTVLGFAKTAVGALVLAHNTAVTSTTTNLLVPPPAAPAAPAPTPVPVAA